MRRRALLAAAALALAALPLGPGRGAPPPARVLAWDGVLPVDEKSPLRWPVAVAGGAPGELAVADAADRRVRLFAEGPTGWGPGPAVTLPAAPVALAHDGRRFLAALRDEPRLVALEGEQLQIRHIPLPQGSVPGALAGLPGGGFLVLDTAGSRLLELSDQGSVKVRAQLPAGITAVAPAPGGFLALSPAAAEVRRFNPAGEEMDRWNVPGVPPVPAWPASLAAAPDGSLVLADRHGGRLVVLGSSGQVVGVGSRLGWAPGLLRFPAAVAHLGEGRYAVADLGNSRVQIFRRVAAGSGP